MYIKARDFSFIYSHSFSYKIERQTEVLLPRKKMFIFRCQFGIFNYDEQFYVVVGEIKCTDTKETNSPSIGWDSIQS